MTFRIQNSASSIERSRHGPFSPKNRSDARVSGMPAVAWFVLISIINQPALADSQGAVLSFKSDIVFRDLPPSVEKRFPPGLGAAELSKRLLQQPKLVLDGATLDVSESVHGAMRYLAFDEVELLNGARIVVGATSTDLIANTIISEGGAITSFVTSDMKRLGVPSPGQNGGPGLDSGNLTLYGKLREGDVLLVDVRGQGGQDGGPGIEGAPGGAGSRGENGVDHLLDCAHGGGNGGPGKPGEKGGDGGQGGAGGRGGDLVLWGEIAGQRSQINYLSNGGLGGRGGGPGIGGAGGPGGEGGSGSTYCRGGRAGDVGPNGPDGRPGADGANGADGTAAAG